MEVPIALTHRNTSAIRIRVNRQCTAKILDGAHQLGIAKPYSRSQHECVGPALSFLHQVICQIARQRQLICSQHGFDLLRALAVPWA
jgi:hypothetical protein